MATKRNSKAKKTVKKTKKNANTKLILISAIVFVLLFVVFAFILYKPQITACASIKKLDTGLYYMNFKGDYGLKEFLEQGGACSDEKLGEYIGKKLSTPLTKIKVKPNQINGACSTIYAKNSNNESLFGRNYDWTSANAMIVHTIPVNGYESYSTCNLDFLGYGKDWKPNSFFKKYKSLASIYAPLDGINEKGLCVADLIAGDRADVNQDTQKPDLTTFSAIRGILDNCSTVLEAVRFLEKYDMHNSNGFAHHFAIADTKGNSVDVEYVDNHIVVTDTRVLTNHYLASTKYGEGSENSHKRFQVLDKLEEDNSCVLSDVQVLDGLKNVRASKYSNSEKTYWTIVYNMDKLQFDFYSRENFDKKNTYKF